MKYCIIKLTITNKFIFFFYLHLPAAPFLFTYLLIFLHFAFLLSFFSACSICLSSDSSCSLEPFLLPSLLFQLYAPAASPSPYIPAAHFLTFPLLLFSFSCVFGPTYFLISARLVLECCKKAPEGRCLSPNNTEVIFHAVAKILHYYHIFLTYLLKQL